MAQTRPQLLVSVIETLIAALGNKDKEAFTRLFSPEAILRDPFGIREYQGLEGLQQYWDDTFKIWFYYDMRLNSYYMGGENRVAVRWAASGTALNNKIADFTGIAIYDFNKGQEITLIESYWNYERVLAQIKNE